MLTFQHRYLRYITTLNTVRFYASHIAFVFCSIHMYVEYIRYSVVMALTIHNKPTLANFQKIRLTECRTATNNLELFIQNKRQTELSLRFRK